MLAVTVLISQFLSQPHDLISYWQRKQARKLPCILPNSAASARNVMGSITLFFAIKSQDYRALEGHYFFKKPVVCKLKALISRKLSLL